MKLYKLEASNWQSFFGERNSTTNMENLIDRDATLIAQTPSCNAFLFLSNTTYEDNVELLDSVPSGYNFTYCQEWGLEVNQTKIDRAIAELNA